MFLCGMIKNNSLWNVRKKRSVAEKKHKGMFSAASAWRLRPKRRLCWLSGNIKSCCSLILISQAIKWLQGCELLAFLPSNEAVGTIRGCSVSERQKGKKKKDCRLAEGQLGGARVGRGGRGGVFSGRTSQALCEAVVTTGVLTPAVLVGLSPPGKLRDGAIMAVGRGRLLLPLPHLLLLLLLLLLLDWDAAAQHPGNQPAPPCLWASRGVWSWSWDRSADKEGEGALVRRSAEAQVRWGDEVSCTSLVISTRISRAGQRWAQTGCVSANRNSSIFLFFLTVMALKRGETDDVIGMFLAGRINNGFGASLRGCWSNGTQSTQCCPPGSADRAIKLDKRWDNWEVVKRLSAVWVKINK